MKNRKENKIQKKITHDEICGAPKNLKKKKIKQQTERKTGQRIMYREAKKEEMQMANTYRQYVLLNLQLRLK